jgi:hypothetical protein
MSKKRTNYSSAFKTKLVLELLQNESDPPLFTGKLLIQFQNILRITTQVIITPIKHSAKSGTDFTSHEINL